MKVISFFVLVQAFPLYKGARTLSSIITSHIMNCGVRASLMI